MRRVCWALLCVLGACGDGGRDLLEVRIPTLPEGTTHLEMRDSQPRLQWQYPLTVKSKAKKTITLRARFEGGERSDMRVLLRRDPRVLRESTGQMRMILVAPAVLGPFEGKVTLFSDELPGWSRTFSFAGEVVERQLAGRYLKPRPAGLALGDLRPGETKEFAVALENTGSERVTLQGWTVSDEARIRLQRRVAEGEIIVPGAQLQLAGTLTAPKQGGPFEARVLVRSDAQNYQGPLAIVLSGNVVTDYGAQPARYGPRVHYPVREAEVKLLLRAREGVPPFTVGSVAGHERFFTLVSKGGAEPAPTQAVLFKLKRDAPTDARRNQTARIRFRIEPRGADVVWPVSLRLLPPIYPQPDSINFGNVEQGTPAQKEFVLAAIGSRRFEVTSVQAEAGQFVVLTRHAQGMQWRFLVGIPNGAPRGLYQDRIVIQTDDPDVPKIIVEVKAVVQ